MRTAERRLEILKYLCKTRKAKMTQLSERFGVSIRTIYRDIHEIEATFHIPIIVKCGKYDGGVYVIDGYTFDHSYMLEEELLLLRKMQTLLQGQLSEEEESILSQILKKYSKIS